MAYEEIEQTEDDYKPKKKKSKTKIVEFCNKWIKKIDSKNSDFKTNRIEALRYYNAESLSDKDLSDDVKKKRRRSSFVQPVVADHVHWALPIFMKIFAGDEEITTTKPVERTDVKGAAYMQELINYQFRVKNAWYITLMDFLLDAFLLKIGIFKYQWCKETKYLDKEFDNLTEMELTAKLQNPNAKLHILERDIKESGTDMMPMGIKPPTINYNATIRYKVEDEYPLVEAIPPCDFGFIDNGNIDKSPLVYHRFRLTEYEFIEKYGRRLFNKVKDVKPNYGDESDSLAEERQDEKGTVIDNTDTEDMFTGYECFYWDKDDGMPMIADVCNDILLKTQNNKYDRPPVRIFTPHKISHRIRGLSFYDLLKTYQKLMSVLIRQQLENIYHINNKRLVVDPLITDADSVENNNFPGGIIKGRIEGIKELESTDLGQGAFGTIEYINKTIEYHGGIPRSYQGVDVRQLGKTFRGQSQQIYQASQRIEMMNRLLAEMAISPLVGDFGRMNMKFLKRKTSLRILNDWVEFEPDAIVGNYDYIVNTGVGTNNKDLVVMQMQQVLGLYTQIKKTGIPIITSQNAFNAMKELVKAMGFKNTDDFVTDPKFVEAVMALMQTAGMHMMKMGVQDPELVNALQLVASNLGMMGERKRNQQEEKTSIEKPEGIKQPGVPEQPQPQTTTSDGGGFFG